MSVPLCICYSMYCTSIATSPGHKSLAWCVSMPPLPPLVLLVWHIHTYIHVRAHTQEAAYERFPLSQAAKWIPLMQSRDYANVLCNLKIGCLFLRFACSFWILGMCSAFSGSHIHSCTGTHTCAGGREGTLPQQWLTWTSPPPPPISPQI